MNSKSFSGVRTTWPEALSFLRRSTATTHASSSPGKAYSMTPSRWRNLAKLAPFGGARMRTAWPGLRVVALLSMAAML